MSNTNTSLWHRFVSDKNGHPVWWQFPNAPIGLWAIASLLGGLFSHGKIDRLLTFLSVGALFTWAWLEIFQGASPLRRVLGAVVMGYLIRSHVW